MSEKFSENTSINRHIFICEYCDYKTSKRSEYDRHLSTLKHKKASLSRKNIEKYSCTICHFKCSYKSDFDRHILSLKHKKLEKKREKNASNQTNETEINKSCFHCSYCDYSCRYKSIFDKHLRSSKHINQTSTDNDKPNNTINNDTVNAILQDNVEMRKLLKEQQEQMKDQQEQHHKQIQELIPQLNQITNINTTNQNNCNNKFNLNFFLNEQCKDAMSIQNFIQNLNIGIKELEHMGDVGYVNGMMNIFSNTLGAMDVYKRPLHCTDLKRETLYIKQGDTWEKDTEDKSSLKKLIKSVERKNYGTLRQWEKQHPDAFECDTPDNIEYMKISTESLGGEQSTDALKLNKIMKHVIREVYVK